MASNRERPSASPTPSGFVKFHKKNRGQTSGTEPYLSIYANGKGRFNQIASERWLADTDHVVIYLDTERDRLAFQPSEPALDAYKLRGHKDGRIVSLRAVLPEFGLQHTDLTQGDQISLTFDSDAGVLVADLGDFLAEAGQHDPGTWCGICGYGPSSPRGVAAHHGNKHDGETDLRDSDPTKDESEDGEESEQGADTSDSDSEDDETDDADPNVWCGICGYGPNNVRGVSSHHGANHDGDTQIVREPPETESEAGAEDEAEEEEEEETQTEPQDNGLPEFSTFDIPEHITADAVQEAVNESSTIIDVADALDWEKQKVRTVLYRTNLYKDLSNPEGGRSQSAISGMGAGRR